MRNRRKSGRTRSTPSPSAFKAGDGRLRGKGPKKGAPNAGRPPKTFYDFCAKELMSPRMRKRIRRILRSGDDKTVLALWRELGHRTHGAPTQKVETRLTLADLVQAANEIEESES